MFEIDETSGGVSVTDTFNANDLPINEIVLYIKAFQIDKPNDRYGTVNLKLSYDYNKEPPEFNINSIIIHINETGTLTKPGQIKATSKILVIWTKCVRYSCILYLLLSASRYRFSRSFA